MLARKPVGSCGSVGFAADLLGECVENRTYDRIAALYNILDVPHEYTWRRRHRASLFEGLSGRVLDAGVGTGRNVAFYPDDCEVVAIDQSEAMLRVARAQARRAGKAVSFHQMDVLDTDFPDAHFDGIVAVLLFGILREDQQFDALKELRRICKPNGTIRLLDYALSKHPLIRPIMALAKPWSIHVFAQRFDAKTEPHVSAAGLELVESRLLCVDMAKILVLRPADQAASVASLATPATEAPGLPSGDG